MTREEILKCNVNTVFKFSGIVDGINLINLKANPVLNRSGIVLTSNQDYDRKNEFLFYFGNFYEHNSQFIKHNFHSADDYREVILNYDEYKEKQFWWVPCRYVSLYSREIKLFEDD